MAQRLEAEGPEVNRGTARYGLSRPGENFRHFYFSMPEMASIVFSCKYEQLFWERSSEMIKIKIGSEERNLTEIDPSWINQQINRRSRRMSQVTVSSAHHIV